MFYKMKDLPEDIQEVLRQPCPTCGTVGIHECKYNEESVREKLERDALNKTVGVPDKVDRSYNLKAPKKYTYKSKPEITEKCESCGSRTQSVNGYCYSCTVKKRNKPKPEWEFVKDEFGRIIGKKFLD